jgi:hypothetical protein
VCVVYSFTRGAEPSEVAEKGICDDFKYSGGCKTAMVIEHKKCWKKSSEVWLVTLTSPKQKVSARIYRAPAARGGRLPIAIAEGQNVFKRPLGGKGPSTELLTTSIPGFLTREAFFLMKSIFLDC